jgi:DNA mismatch repair protein MutS2
VGWFSLVLSDMGDAQSIPRSLSTFSAHVSHLASLLRYATDRTLILLDEVAAGTDPDEGSALAAALLEALIDRQAAVAVTTHYERLKELAARTEGFVNASVGFDLDSFIPNFRLLPDTPGPSTALAVARRFSIPEAVVDRARSLLERPAVDREEVLARLHADRKALEEARRDAEGERARQRELSAQLISEIEAAKDRQRSRLARESDELFDEIRSARAELRQLRASLSEKSATRQSVRRAERSVDQVARHLALGGRIAEHIRPSSTARAPVAQRLSPGMQVRVRRLGAVGTVLEAEHRGQVRIQVGSLRMSSPVEELDLIDGRPPAPARPAKRSTDRKLSPGLSGVTEVLRTSDNTLDIRGLRVDEAEAEVDDFIDQLLRTRDTYGFVLHGHGTGALKSAVRSHLAASKHVVRSRPAEPGEGGDAFTVLWIEG